MLLVFALPALSQDSPAQHTVRELMQGADPSSSRIRGFFEWGEYDSLFTTLGLYFTARPDTVESDTFCIYLSYLGVAYFAKGDIAESQAQFRRALECNPRLNLDKKYVTPEMLNLFASVKNDVEQKRAFMVQEQSIREALELQRYEQESNRKHEARLRSMRWKHTAIAVILGAGGVTLGALAANRFINHRPGDGITFAIPSALCGTLCVGFTIKAVSDGKQLRKRPE
jgi:tetratricopeptide (TPR) repeat protein